MFFLLFSPSWGNARHCLCLPISLSVEISKKSAIFTTESIDGLRSPDSYLRIMSRERPQHSPSASRDMPYRSRSFRSCAGNPGGGGVLLFPLFFLLTSCILRPFPARRPCNRRYGDTWRSNSRSASHGRCNLSGCMPAFCLCADACPVSGSC